MKKIIFNLLCKILFYVADDVLIRHADFSYEYESAPEDLKGVIFYSCEFHLYKNKDRKKCLDWLESEPD